MGKQSRIFVAGHNGLVGSATMRRLQANGYTNIIARSRKETDLENQGAVFKLFLEQHGMNAIGLMPTNFYGPGDNFDLNASHAIPALIRKFHEAKLAGAKKLVMWGTGTPRREFLHVDNLADACLHMLTYPSFPGNRQCGHRRGCHRPRVGGTGEGDCRLRRRNRAGSQNRTGRPGNCSM